MSMLKALNIVALPKLTTGVPESIEDGLVSVPWAVIAVQDAELRVSPVFKTGLKSKEKFSDSVVYLYENWLIFVPCFAFCWLMRYEL